MSYIRIESLYESIFMCVKIVDEENKNQQKKITCNFCQFLLFLRVKEEEEKRRRKRSQKNHCYGESDKLVSRLTARHQFVDILHFICDLD